MEDMKREGMVTLSLGKKHTDLLDEIIKRTRLSKTEQVRLLLEREGERLELWPPTENLDSDENQ